MSGSSSGGCLKTLIIGVIVVAALVCLPQVFKSGSSSGGGNAGSGTINGYTVKEYNADVDKLANQLNKAKSLDSQIEQMGDPNAFTSQEQVDRYNNLVDQYNEAANQYNSMAKSFASKYKMQIDGAGSRPADPNQIDLPPKR